MRRIRLVPDGTRLPFFCYRWIAFAWSFFVLGATLLMVPTVGLNYGIDFRGGILLEVRTPGPADLAAMRSTLGGLGLGEVALQEAGAPDEVLIRVESQEGGEAAQRNAIETIKHALDGALGGGAARGVHELVGRLGARNVPQQTHDVDHGAVVKSDVRVVALARRVVLRPAAVLVLSF